jgi:hypothetical protein
MSISLVNEIELLQTLQFEQKKKDKLPSRAIAAKAIDIDRHMNESI